MDYETRGSRKLNALRMDLSGIINSDMKVICYWKCILQNFYWNNDATM